LRLETRGLARLARRRLRGRELLVLRGEGAAELGDLRLARRELALEGLERRLHLAGRLGERLDLRRRRTRLAGRRLRVRRGLLRGRDLAVLRLESAFELRDPLLEVVHRGVG